MDSKDKTIAKVLSLGRIWVPFLTLLPEQPPREALFENYRSVTMLLQNLGVQIALPDPRNKEEVNRFINYSPAVMSSLSQEINGQLNLLFSVEIGRTFLLSTLITAYEISYSADTQGSQTLVIMRDDIRRVV